MFLLDCAFRAFVASAPSSLQSITTVTNSQSGTKLALLGKTSMLIHLMIDDRPLFLTATSPLDIRSGFWSDSALSLSCMVSASCSTDKGLLGRRGLGFLFFGRPSLPVTLGTRFLCVSLQHPQHRLISVTSL